MTARVVVCGLAGELPMGGMGLHYAQYCLGLTSLGVEVLYLEDNGSSPYDPTIDDYSSSGDYSVAWLRRMFDSLGLAWSYQAPDGRYHGMSERDVRDWCAASDLLLNVSGALHPRAHHLAARRLAYIDTDPGFVQVAAATGEAGVREWLGAHDVLFTFAESAGRPSCRLPEDGLPWVPTRQPVHLPFWSDVPAMPGEAYTTVMQWRSYAPTQWNGEDWGQKDAEFHHVRELPRQVDRPLELALGGASAPREELAAVGWCLRDPIAASADVWSYRDYLAGSRGELTVAKQAYVRSRGGWFSERSANYLAAGRPVIAQDTGWSEHLPAGRGLLAFDDEQGARTALAAVEADLPGHAAAARRVAADCFDARVVLDRLLSDAGVP